MLAVPELSFDGDCHSVATSSAIDTGKKFSYYCNAVLADGSPANYNKYAVKLHWPTLVNSVQVYGGDLSPGMLKIAKEKNIYTDLRIFNLKNLRKEDFLIALSAVEFSSKTTVAQNPYFQHHTNKGGLMITTVRKRFHKVYVEDYDMRV